jgi:hypothetical protein
MSRRNPKTGSHPDLFFQGRTYQAGGVEGETPVFVPLESLTRAQLVKMKRAAFTNAEWDELDEDVREEIYENDGDSQARIAEFANPFISSYEWSQDMSQRGFHDIEAGFEHWLANSASHELMQRKRPRLYDELYNRHGIGNDVDQMIDTAMEDSNHYSSERDRQSDDEVYSEEMRGSFQIDGSDVEEQIEKAWPWPGGERPAGAGICTFPDELELALEKIKRDTNYTFDWDEARILRAITPRRGFMPGLEEDWDTGEYMKMYINWESVAEAVREAIDEAFAEAEDRAPDDADPTDAAPPEERVVFRWPDGFYVQDLLPSELVAEGKAMGMCVGRPDMGYGKAVRKGEIKILSMRRPSGKPLFTIEAELANDDKKIYRIDQIKGKANRLPGFDLGADTHTPIKRDEVQRVYEFIEGSEFQKMTGPPGIAVDDIRDAKPAAKQVNELFHAGDKWAVQLLARLGIEPEKTTWTPVAQVGNPGSACGLHGSQCTGFCVPYRSRRQERETENPADPWRKVRPGHYVLIASEEVGSRRIEILKGYTRMYGENSWTVYGLWEDGARGFATLAEAKSEVREELRRREAKTNPPGDTDEAHAHAVRLAAALARNGIQARPWSKPGVGARVYVGQQFMSVSRGGDTSHTLRGAHTFREAALYQSQRPKFRKAMAEYREESERILDEQMREFER